MIPVADHQALATTVGTTSNVVKQPEELDMLKVDRLSIPMQQKDGTTDSFHVRTWASPSLGYISLLKDCSKRKDIIKGCKIHDEISRKGLLAGDPYLSSTLISMYAKCGALERAKKVLDGHSTPNVVLWNALITGYVQHGYHEKALECLELMQYNGILPDAVTFTCILKSCASLGASKKGQEIHLQIVRERLLEKDVMIGNALIDMYAKCGKLDKAQEVFNELRFRDVVSWNALLTGYTQHGYGKEALQLYEQMQYEGFSPTVITYTCVLKACGIVRALDVGKEVHAEIKAAGLLKKDVMVANALIDMYARCGALKIAEEVFENLPTCNVISWTTLIAGYIENGQGERALECFEEMQSHSFPPNAFTFSCILKACGTSGFLSKGQEIHSKIVKNPILGEDIMVGTALVDMYAKCGLLERAQNLFEELSKWDVVSWNALISGYVHHKYNEEALSCFEQMKKEGFLPDEATYACILKACGSTGCLWKGKKLHTEIVRRGSFEERKDVGIALVVMYANCCMLVDAQMVFDNLNVRDVVAWTVLMAGYSQIGADDVVLELFEKMIKDGVQPNLVAFLIVLNTCSHRGLLEKGQAYYEMISQVCQLSPTVEHHACMIDLFCRAGDLDKAAAFIKETVTSPNPTLWRTLLSACVARKNLEYGRWAFENIVKLDRRDSSAYISMSNLYTAAGRLNERNKIEALMMELRVDS